MKNLILQHYEGELPHCLELAVETVREYAKSIGAEYKFVTGYPFSKDLYLTGQKFCFMNEEYDEYDNVALFDTDVVMKKDGADIFEHPGICYINVRCVDRAKKENYPDKVQLKLAGQLYKATKEQRRLLREAYDVEELGSRFDLTNHKVDEFIFFYLLYKTGLLAKDNHIPRDWTMEFSINHPYETTHGFHFGPEQELIPEFLETVHDQKTLMDFKYKHVDVLKYEDKKQNYIRKTYYSHDYYFWG